MKYLLLDVDGVLDPCFSNGSWRKRNGRDGWIQRYAVVDGQQYKQFLCRYHGKWLTDAAQEADAQLVWATTWNEDANSHVGPKLGLPRLPVIEVEPGKKPEAVAAWAKENDATYAWLDDDYKVVTSPLLAGKVVWVDPRVGLTERDVRFAVDYLKSR